MAKKNSQTSTISYTEYAYLLEDKVIVPSNSAWPTPTMMMDIGSLAACEEIKLWEKNNKKSRVMLYAFIWRFDTLPADPHSLKPL